MSLPHSRNITMNASDPCPSSLLNGLQDCIVQGAKPIMGRGFFPAFINSPAGWTPVFGAGTSYLISAGGVTPGFLVVPETEQGDRILHLEARVYGDATVDATFTTYVIGADGVVTQLDVATSTNAPAQWDTLWLRTVNFAYWNRVLGAGESLLVSVAPSGANFRLGNFTLIYDRPLTP